MLVGELPDIKLAMLQRNWKEITNPNKTVFDF